MENSAFEHALSAEIVASEQMRLRVLAAALAILLLLDQLLFLTAPTHCNGLRSDRCRRGCRLAQSGRSSSMKSSSCLCFAIAHRMAGICRRLRDLVMP